MNPNNQILAVLKPQLIFNNINYRLMKFNMIVDIDNGKLIFNELTRAIIFMTNEEFANVFDKDRFEFLYRNYFLVPEDFNEIEITDMVRSHFIREVDDKYLDKANSYNILTTTKCNARCFYCYEAHEKKEHMTEETARKVVRYIKEHANKSKPISLRWFGGEPLFNMKIIDIICNGLRDSGYKFSSSFTTNGYLFDTDVITKAINSWHITFAQITIDGTERVYNKAKNYIYKTKISPYRKVLNNIAMLLNNNISVSVRMNCDTYNIEDLKNLIVELKSRFGNHRKLHPYVYPIFEDEHYKRTDEERMKVFQGVAELEQTLIKNGYSVGPNPSNMIAYSQCMADSGGVISINPGGNLGVCEHFINSDFFGHLDSKEKNLDILRGWKVYEKPIDLCSSCPRYPSCIRPSKCVEMSKCDKFYQEWHVRKDKLGLINWYKNVQLQKAENINNSEPIKVEQIQDKPNLLKKLFKWM